MDLKNNILVLVDFCFLLSYAIRKPTLRMKRLSIILVSFFFFFFCLIHSETFSGPSRSKDHTVLIGLPVLRAFCNYFAKKMRQLLSFPQIKLFGILTETKHQVR